MLEELRRSRDFWRGRERWPWLRESRKSNNILFSGVVEEGKERHGDWVIK